MAELGPMDRVPEPHPPRTQERLEYIVGDYINMVITIDHGMHLLEARVVFEPEEDESIPIILEGVLERDREFASSMMRSVLRISQRVEVEDVPGVYRFLHFEAVTASMRTLRRLPAAVRSNLKEFAIVPESNDLKIGMMIDSYTRDPLDTSEEEGW